MMKANITTQIQINGTSAQVWNVLMKTEDYQQWNPFIRSLSGALKVGNKIRIQLPGMSFKPIVKELIANKKFSWLGKFMFKGIFEGHHQFELVDNGKFTTFIHKEDFSGWLVKWFMKNRYEETKREFEQMNIALKKQVESLN